FTISFFFHYSHDLLDLHSFPTRRSSDLTILGCGYNAEKCSMPKAPKTDGHYVDYQRIEKMARLRNIYLDEVKKVYRDDPTWDYVDRKSTRLNSSHSQISYAVFCLKKKKK